MVERSNEDTFMSWTGPKHGMFTMYLKLGAFLSAPDVGGLPA